MLLSTEGRFPLVPRMHRMVVLNKAKFKRQRSQPETTEKAIFFFVANLSAKRLTTTLHWGQSSSACENEWAKIGVLDFADTFAVFPLLYSLRFFEELRGFFVDIASGKWRYHFNIEERLSLFTPKTVALYVATRICLFVGRFVCNISPLNACNCGSVSTAR